MKTELTRKRDEMPNHVVNTLTGLSDEAIASLAGEPWPSGDERLVDFRNFIPHPPELVLDEVSYGVTSLAKHIAGKGPASESRGGGLINALIGLEGSNLRDEIARGGICAYDDSDFASFVACCRSLRACGFASWYDWNTANWGTKWNAYSITVGNGIVRFKTAWGPPHPVIEAMAAELEQGFEHRWADEDIGVNLGLRFYSEHGAWNTATIAEPYRFARDLHGITGEVEDAG